MMTETRSPSIVAIVLVAVAAVVALASGLVAGRQETRHAETYAYTPEEHAIGEGVVLSKTERGGLDLFGFTVRQPDRYVQVAFTLPVSCAVGEAEQWPIDQPGCTGPEGLLGTIAGGGITATREHIVLVETAVDRDCHGAVELGSTWPPPAPHCELSIQ